MDSDLFAEITAGSSSSRGIVRDSDTDGALVEFQREDGPLLKIADELDARFVGPRIQKPPTIRMRVVQRTDQMTHRSYKLRPTNTRAANLQARFKRRKSYRAKPDAREPVDVEIRSSKLREAVHAQLHDLSTTGLAVLVSREDESVLFETRDVELEFPLPDDVDEKVKLAGSIRSRQLTGSVIRYGILFDAELMDYEKTEERLRRWVMARQSEMIRRARERKEEQS